MLSAENRSFFMAKTKEQKQGIIEELTETMGEQKSIVLLDFSNLPSTELFALRENLQAENCLLRVAKKTLLQKTLERLGKKDLAEKVREIKSQLALAFGLDDEIAPARICHLFSKEHENLKILGGVFANEFLEKEKVLGLAQFVSKKAILAGLVGSLQGPIANFVYVLKANIKGLISVLRAIKETK